MPNWPINNGTCKPDLCAGKKFIINYIKCGKMHLFIINRGLIKLLQKNCAGCQVFSVAAARFCG